MRSPHTLRVKSCGGFTVVEFMVAALITGVIVTVMLFAFTAGERSLSVSGIKIDTQAEARRTIDWIINDVRQAVVWDLAAAGNNPSNTHVKFRKVDGWNTTSDTFLFANNYTQYSYNATAEKIVRSLLDLSNNTLQTWQFNNVVLPPFYTKNAGGSIVALNSGDLLVSRVLVIAVDTQQAFRSSLLINSTIISEVKIRNE